MAGTVGMEVMGKMILRREHHEHKPTRLLDEGAFDERADIDI